MFGVVIDSGKVVYSNINYVYWLEAEKVFRGKQKNKGGATGRAMGKVTVHKHTIEEVKRFCGSSHQNQGTIKAMVKLGVPIYYCRKRKKVYAFEQ